MKDLILKNTNSWVKKASIRYVSAMSYMPYCLTITTNIKHEFPETFKTQRSAKIFFTKNYFKGVWEEEN